MRRGHVSNSRERFWGGRAEKVPHDFSLGDGGTPRSRNDHEVPAMSDMIVAGRNSATATLAAPLERQLSRPLTDFAAPLVDLAAAAASVSTPECLPPILGDAK